MKKILFSLAAFAALATACQVEDINENITPEGEKYVIEAAIASTKTVYEPPFSVSWAEGDALSVVPQYADGSYAGYEFKWTDGTTFVSENVTNPAEIEALNVIYPSDLEYIKNIDSEGFASGFTYFGSRSDAAQTQNGTDNASHIAAPLYGYATVTAEGTPVVEMKHASTLFEVIVTNNAGKEISVSNIKVTNSENKSMIGTFYINPQTGALKEGQYVSATANLNVTNGTIADNAKGNFYFTSAPFELAAGSTLTVTITTGDGESTIVKNITEASAFEAGKVNHINVTVEEIETIEYLTVAEALAVANESIVNVQGLVTAVNSRGCVLSDETGYVYIYNGSNLNVEVGDYIKVTGTRGEFNKADQIEGPSVIVVSSGNPVSYPEPKVLDGSAADSFVSSPEAGYVQITGELSVSGSYYNVIIPGAGSAQGSISYPRDSDTIKQYDGTTVTVSGYYVGISGSRYLNIMLTDIKGEPYCNVTPSTVNVAADATSATFKVDANVEWTIASDNPDFKVSPASGSETAEITVTFPVNETSETVTAVLTVSSELGEKTVTISQTATSALTIILDAASQPCPEFPNTSAGETTAKTYTIDGYEWTFSPSSGNKFSWYSQGYILWGKQGAYILMPAVPDKHLTSVTILTGKNASKSVKVGVYTEDGASAVSGGEAIQLNKTDAEFSWSLTGTENNTAYQLRVCSAHNAQLQKLTLIYE